MGRRRWVLVAVALVAAAAAGCGGGGEQDLTAGLSPTEILDQSRQAASAVSSYHPNLTVTLELNAEGGSSRGPLAGLAGQPITLTADGPVRRPIAEGGPAFSFDVTAKAAGLTLQGRLTKLEDAVYFSVGDQAFQLDVPPEQAKAVRIPPQPALFVDSPTEVGREDVSGVSTVHLQGKVATDAVIDFLVEVLRSAPALIGGNAPPDDAAVAAMRQQVSAAVQESESDVWIGTSDLLPYRVAAHLVLVGPLALLPGVSGGSLDVSADVGGFDEQVDSTAPANPKPLDPGNLAGLLPF